MSPGPGVFEGTYYDGKSALRRPARAQAAQGRLRILGDALDAEFALGEVGLQRSISGERFTLSLPGGAQLRTADVAAVQAIFGASGGRDEWVRKLESGWRFAAAALVLIVTTGAWAWAYGVPMVARHVAERTPIKMQQEMGEQTLAFLDKALCHESRFTRERHDQIRRVAVQRLVAGFPDWGRYQLEFRDCPAIGPNAFALPDALFVMTDDLVRLAANDHELTAVMAHEIGHARNHHALRMTVQATGVAIVVSTLASDAVSITALAAALPAMFLETGYSRRFEEEADDYALRRLSEVGVPTENYAKILERLDEAHRRRSGGEAENDYLSTHPASAARIERARSFRP